MRVFRYKLDPTPIQSAAIDRTMETLRVLYNRALQERKTAYEARQATLNAYDQAKTLITDDRKYNADLATVNVGIAKDCLLRLDKAFTAFFRRVKRGEKPGYPKFKRKNDYKTFAFATHGNGCKWEGSHVTLQNIGRIKVHFYRPLPDGATVKNLSVSKRASGYYVCVLLNEPEIETPANTLPAVGIDAGYGWAFMMTSAGDCYAPERHYHNSMEQLAEKLRKRETFQRHSWRYREMNRQIARLHEHIAGQRKHWHIHVANDLLARYGIIIHEKLQITDMAERPKSQVDLETGEYQKTGAEATVHSRRNIYDMAWGEFFAILHNQAARKGGKIIEVDAADTTQTCSGCGKLSARKIQLRDTAFVCTACGLHLDRKINAARVILQRGTAQNL